MIAESYVPASRDELVEMLVRHGNLDDAEAVQFRRLGRLIAAAFHIEFHERLEHLKRLYAPFDPDSDARPIGANAGRNRAAAQDELLDAIGQVLTAAHYHPLSEQELDRALSGATYWGLDLAINRDIFDRLMIYVRGDSSTSRVRRDIGTFFRRKVVELEVYERLVLAVKLRGGGQHDEQADADNIHLKLFREIPKLDLEMLLPGTRPRMRLVDSGKIGASSVWGLFSLSKMLIEALLYAKLIWFTFLIGSVSYALQSFLGYRRTRKAYDHSVTQQLYYQNLDNNVGVFCRVIDEAEAEEAKEAILAYYFLWRRGDEAWTPDRLGRQIEDWVRTQTGEACRFQVHDAISKLARCGVLVGEDSQLRATPLDLAQQRLVQQLTGAVGSL